jgi:hypothetical protein
MISQDFTNPTNLLVVLNRLRRRFAQFKLCAHFLDLGGLLLNVHKIRLDSGNKR